MLRIVKLLKHQSKIYTDIIGYIRRKTWKYYSEYYRKCEINSKWSRETISLTPHAHCLSAEKDWWFKLPTVFRTIEMIATKTLKHLGKPKMLLNGKGYLPSAVMYQKRTRLITIQTSMLLLLWPLLIPDLILSTLWTPFSLLCLQLLIQADVYIFMQFSRGANFTKSFFGNINETLVKPIYPDTEQYVKQAKLYLLPCYSTVWLYLIKVYFFSFK